MMEQLYKELKENGWVKDGNLWRHETFGDELLTFDEAIPNLPSQKANMPEGWADWNQFTLEQHVEILERKFRVDSSGIAKSVFELIAFYETNKDRDPNRSEAKLYTIEDRWERRHAEVHRVIAEGTNLINGIFTEEEADEYIESQQKRDEITEFKQYRIHEYVKVPTTKKPLD